MRAPETEKPADKKPKANCAYAALPEQALELMRQAQQRSELGKTDADLILSYLKAYQNTGCQLPAAQRPALSRFQGFVEAKMIANTARVKTGAQADPAADAYTNLRGALRELLSTKPN